MILFPNCKINLGLNVIRKRDDGYHDLETAFYPIAIKDVLEIIKAKNPNQNIQYSASGFPIEGQQENNLCIKAYQLLKNDFPQLPSIELHLHKTIPQGAGLGGGSSNGTFTLLLLNKKFELNLSTEKLLDYALKLGSDCPFFIINKPCFATRRGEFLTLVDVNLSNYKFIVVNPGIHISTGEAFSLTVPEAVTKSIKDIILQPIDTWRKELKNDFEEPLFKKYIVIKEVKDKMYNAGAVYASMTGSGSTVYGIFESSNNVQLSFPSHYFVKELTGQLQ
jgi:4-diphosphocytidyl-2-C-methyl-D-erythritol kinase